MVLPLGLRGLAVTEAISLYGGLAVFSGLVLYEYVVSQMEDECYTDVSFAVLRRFFTTLASQNVVSFRLIRLRSPSALSWT